MKNLSAVLAWFLLALFWLAPPANGDAVDRYVGEQIKVRKLPGVSLAVVRHGRLVKSAGYGFAQLENGVPATAQTIYEIGSITKHFTAIAMLLLVEEGKVDLDDPLHRYLAGLPVEWSALTIRHVLTHTSGLADFDTGNIGFSYRREYTAAEFISLLGAQPLAFPPGTQWKYTNAFALLGMVIEAVSGQSYGAFMQARFFGPLGLKSARLKSVEVVPHRADGYVLNDGRHKRGEPLRPAVIAANGGILMSVADFAAWDMALTAGRLLKPSTLSQLTKPSRLADGRTMAYGLGWFMDTFAGHRFGAYWGSTLAGYSSVIRRYDDGLTVMLLANLGDGASAVDAMSKQIANLYLPGTAIQGLRPAPDPAPAETAMLRDRLKALAAGQETAGVKPGLAGSLPEAVRDQIARALRSSRFEWLGQEECTEFHFRADPAVSRLRRYAARGDKAVYPTLFLTLQLGREGSLLGVTVEE